MVCLPFSCPSRRGKTPGAGDGCLLPGLGAEPLQVFLFKKHVFIVGCFLYVYNNNVSIVYTFRERNALFSMVYGF